MSRDVIFDGGVFPKFVPKFSPTLEFDADNTDTEDTIKIRNDNDSKGTESYDNSNEISGDVESKDEGGTEILTENVNNDDDDASNENDHSHSEQLSEN